MESFKKILFKRFKSVVVIAFFLVLIASGNSHKNVTTYYINNAKSLGSAHIVSKYDASVEAHTPILANNLTEVRNLAHDNGVFFYGTMTGYGPDCEGCGGHVGCYPNQDVRNGNIYYKDKKYGKVRILAADRSIPCGSIIRIDNFSFNNNESLYGIVLDRGSAIVGLTMDLLYPSEADTEVIGRNYNIIFTIERWGW